MNVSKLLRMLKKLLVVVAACLMVSSAYADASNLTVSISQLDDDKFPDVSAYISVLGPNGIPVLGLTRDQVQIVEDGNLVEDYVMNVVQHTEDPLSLAIVIDRSNSMWLQDDEGNTALKNTLDAVASVLQKLGRDDTVGIYTFSSEVELIQDFTIDKKLAERALSGITPEGSTVLWDAVHTAAMRLKDVGDGRKAVIVVTDGKEGEGEVVQSTIPFEELVSQLTEHGLPVFSVGFGDVDIESLTSLAESTGGSVHISDGVTDISKNFDQVFQRLMLQYVLHFRSALPADGSNHELGVTVEESGNVATDNADFVAFQSACQISVDGISEGAKVRGEVTFQADFVCRSEPVSISLSIDGQTVADMNGSATEIKWDSTTVELGIHNLTLLVTDANGNNGEADFLIEVVPDTLTMNLQVYQHGEVMDYVEGERVAGVIIIKPSFVGPATVGRVEYAVSEGLASAGTSNSPLFTSREPNFSYDWDTQQLEPGVYTLQVLAEDGEGNTTTKAISVEIVPIITLDVLSPKDGETVDEQVELRAVSEALAGVSKVEFYVDDSLIVDKAEAPYEHTWSTTALAPGDHVLKVRAIDTNGERIEVSVPIAVEVGASIGFVFVVVVAAAAIAVVIAATASARKRNRFRSN
jgi:VWFA-related protein